VFSNGEYTHIEDGQQRSPITSICVYDIDKDKAMEIIVGTDDGRIEALSRSGEKWGKLLCDASCGIGGANFNGTRLLFHSVADSYSMVPKPCL
jgi:hypothetical protein